MSYERRHRNPGKRERTAGKRHRRGSISASSGAAALGPLKVGSRHVARFFRRFDQLVEADTCGAMAVAESEKRTTSAPET